MYLLKNNKLMLTYNKFKKNIKKENKWLILSIRDNNILILIFFSINIEIKNTSLNTFI